MRSVSAAPEVELHAWSSGNRTLRLAFSKRVHQIVYALQQGNCDMDRPSPTAYDELPGA